MKVRILVGSTQVYACIKHDGGSMDVRLEPGRSAATSLYQSAAKHKAKAARLLAHAEIMEQAADLLAND